METKIIAKCHGEGANQSALNTMSVSANILTLPLDNGMSVSIPIGMSEETFKVFCKTLQLWKNRIVWKRRVKLRRK